MEKKICGVCGIPKTLDEFHKNPSKKDGVQSMCKDCRKVYHRNHYLRNRQRYIDKAKNYRDLIRDWFKEIRKDLKCEICGEDRYWVLDFHHTNPEEKDGEISDMIRKQLNKEKVLQEISKCKVLCSNCHRDLHYKERQAGDA